ncbi:DUF1992 domain-containing protein [Lentibacillus salicampi]|uniref:DUF1992 domain-containing protein n=1 Tax=Lentibacillus salicampi TaxID=175306 RepID=A0A4Y9AE42_9BACI|nr:DUF1992 domain-containing protein [Lentibacillus salicampi]TFJ92664.1 DUF1992 domain-containing protein [Lentibacillus salicampi]
MYMFVEDQIKEAIDNGEFDNLPGKGKKLNVRDELPGLSPELNQAFKTLKNAGFVPEEDDRKSGQDMSDKDLMTYATGEEYKDDVRKGKQLDDLVEKKKLHRNLKFPFYRKKIFKKLS